MYPVALIADSSLTLIAGGMIAIGLVLTGVTAWFWFAARPEPEALAPLEIMSERQFVEADDEEKERLLDAVRARPASTLGGMPDTGKPKTAAVQQPESTAN